MRNFHQGNGSEARASDFSGLRMHDVLLTLLTNITPAGYSRLEPVQDPAGWVDFIFSPTGSFRHQLPRNPTSLRPQ